MAPPHLGLHILEPHLQQEDLKVRIVAVRRSHDVTVTPQIAVVVGVTGNDMALGFGESRGRCGRKWFQRVTHIMHDVRNR